MRAARSKRWFRGAAEVYRQLTRRSRGERQVLEVPAFAAVAGIAFGKALPDHLYSLFHEGRALTHIHTQGLVLVLDVARADSERKASAGDEVCDDRVLGDPQRVVQRKQEDVRPDPDTPSPGGYCPGDHERRWQVPIIDKVMLRKPDVGEA